MKTYSLSNIDFRVLGRNVKNAGKGKNPLALFWGAAALEVNVNATEVWVKISSDYDSHEIWCRVEVNGFPVSRFMVPKGEPQWICIARNMNPQKNKLISIIKDTQPMPGDSKHSFLIHELGLNDEGKFLPVPQRPLKIEFIGDSITSGEGLAGGCDEQEWITQWFCAGKSYAVRASHALNADWNVFSQCGWGLCWGWNGDRNAKMPPHYEQVCSVLDGGYHRSLGADEKYDFGNGSDFVVLNLGTNDNGAFYQPVWKDSEGTEYPLNKEKDGKFIAQSTVAFLKLIRKHNPHAKIIWSWGMIKLDFVPECIADGVELYKKETGDKAVWLLELDSMEDVEKVLEDKGSRGHPGPKTHKLAAERIVELINRIK